MMSQRTKQLKNKARFYQILSTCSYVVLEIVLIVISLTKVGSTSASTSSTAILTDEIKAKLTSIGISLVIILILTIILKDKLRFIIYFASEVLALILFDKVGVYAVLSIWTIDEYVFLRLYKVNKDKYIINKEIDLRNE